MPRAITGAELLQAVKDQTFIKGGSEHCVEGMKYDFRLGSRILKASYGAPIDMKQLSETERSKVAVEPGEVVFVLTEERLELPKTMKAELSPKRKLSHQGILVLGGFCIDPLYPGRLLVGLYNFSSTPFPLIPGRKLIAALFYELQGTEVTEFPIPEAPIEDFPDELIRLVHDYKPIALQALQDALAELQRQVGDLRNEFISGREWQRQFQASLERHDKQIGELITGLMTEKEAREKGEDKLTDALNKVERTLSWLRGATWVVAVLLGFAATAIVAPLVAPYVAKLLRLG